MEFAARGDEIGGFPALHLLSTDLDWSVARELEARVIELVSEGDRIILDLVCVNFVESGAIGLLITVQQDLAARGAVMAIVCHSNIRRVLDLTGLSGYFRVFDDVDSAVAYLKALR